MLVPLSFNIYTDDLVNSKVYLHADDTKLFGSNNSELQLNLNKVEYNLNRTWGLILDMQANQQSSV